LRNAYKKLVGNLEGKNHMGDLNVDGRIRSTIIMDLREVGCEDVD
jgi:hypothetical protein